MPEPALKCENYAILKQNYAQKLFFSFKISYYCCFGPPKKVLKHQLLDSNIFKMNSVLINR